MTTKPAIKPAHTAKPRRMARQPYRDTAAEAPEALPAAPQARSPRDTSKLDRIEALLLAASGASIAELMAATGWQQHSVRGAIAGALKKRGLTITSDKSEGTRRYRAVRPA